MPQQYEILSMKERGLVAHQGDFNEILYDSLKATPWWLASISFHIVLGFIISVLIGDNSGDLNSLVDLRASMAQDLVDMEEEIEPDVLETKPIDEQEKVIEQPELDESKVDNEAETE